MKKPGNSKKKAAPKKKPTVRKAKESAAKKASAGDQADRLLLKLYVTGNTPQSTKALVNLKRICEEHLKGSYDLQVIDVYQKPELASEQQIIAAPTLVKLLPLPIRRLIGDMSDENKVLLGLSISPRKVESSDDEDSGD